MVVALGGVLVRMRMRMRGLGRVWLRDVVGAR
jgi:hypothetical protein